MQMSVLVLLSVFAMYFVHRARREAHAHTETALLKRVLTRAYAQPGIGGLLRAAFEEFSATLNTDVILFAVRDRRRGQCHVWQVRRTSRESAIHVLSMEAPEEADFFFVPAEQVWLLAAEHGTLVRREAVSGDGQAVPPAALPGPAVMAMSPRSLVALTVPLWDRWDAAILCLDPDPAPGIPQMRRARAIAGELRGPAVNAYDLSRLRSRIVTGQRTRLARDLHDGVLQSLIGLELKIHALRERIMQKDPDLAAGLGQLQRALRKESADARKLMQDLRATAVEPHELAETMASAVMKFQHDSGVTTTFEADDQPAAVSSRVSAELTRILQEALSNVRRHSRARSVIVKLSQQDGVCRLTIEDDGAGFAFAGRRTLEELAATRSGPSTIMERVRLLGGQFAVESFPTRGARLEIVVAPGGRS